MSKVHLNWRKSMKRNLTFLVMAAGLLCSSVWAQTITGNLEGRIFNEKDETLQAVNVAVSGKNIQGMRGAVTDAQGHFRVLALPAGDVSVHISYIGYQKTIFEKVGIRLGQTTTLGDIKLVPESIAMPKITITGTRTSIDPNTTTVGANIAAGEFEALPTERDFMSVITLLPQANTSYLGDDVNIAGSTGQENAYFIDGMNTTDPYKAIGGTELPYNFIEEIEVKSGGYEAEYGRATGGIVNVITYSGSNEFHAKGFGFFTDHRFAYEGKRGFVDLSTGGFSRYDAGLSFAGPVVRDKLWYFLAYNGKVAQEDITFPGLGVRPDRSVANIFAGKLTWQAGANTNMVLSVFGDPEKRDRIGHNFPGPGSPPALGNPDPFLGKWESGGVNFSLKASHAIQQKMLLEGAVSRYDAHTSAEPATERGRREPLYIDNVAHVWSGGYGNAFDHHSVRTAGSFAGTYFLGNHTLKTGLQYENNLLSEDWRWQSNGPAGAGLIGRDAPSFWVVLPLNFQTIANNQVLSFFSQASIAIHPRVRVNAGVRWDGQYIKGKETGYEVSITDQFQPRLGFILQMGESGTEKLTGSFGRFYEQIPNLFSSFIVGNLYQDILIWNVDPFLNPDSGIVAAAYKPSAIDDSWFEKDLKGEHFDELTLGYERQVTNNFKLGVRGVYRTIREIIQNADDPITGAGQALNGNPGRGLLSFLPKPKREYTALELTLQKSGGQRLNFLASYVLSRTYGNYTGLYSSEYGLDIPNAGYAFDNPARLKNATGLLPNDRTHVFKLVGSYRFNWGMLLGTSFNWQSGTPLSEFGHDPNPNGPDYYFIRPRGSVGRTPSIWDLNFRLTYNLNRWLKTPSEQKLILDVFHLFSQRKPVHIEQVHYFAVDPATGEQINENPNYMKAILYQLPMTVRLGLEIGL
jgi:Carboxypeptidase regulatory-like domain/TonB-dependent Receptor Plug Domain